jgi:hypothetical protein
LLVLTYPCLYNILVVILKILGSVLRDILNI